MNYRQMKQYMKRSCGLGEYEGFRVASVARAERGEKHKDASGEDVKAHHAEPSKPDCRMLSLFVG